MLLTLLLLLIPNTNTDLINLSESEQEYIDNHPVIRLGGDPTWEPMLVIKGQTITGFDRDYLDEVSTLTGLKFEIVADNWSEIIQLAQKQEIDGLLYSSPIPERLEYLNFSNPYVNFQAGFYGTLQGNEVKVIWDVLDKRVAIQSSDDFSRDFLDSLSVENVLYYKTRDQIINALKSKEVDLYFGAMDMDYYLVNKGITGVELKYHVLNEGYSAVISLRKDHPELLSIMNKSIDKISGFKNRELMRKWSILPKSKVIVEKSSIANWALITILIVTILSLWIITLLRQVKKRKRIQSSLGAYKQQLQAQIENSSGIIYTLDRDFRIVVKNTNLDRFVKVLRDRPISTGDKILDFMTEPNKTKWKKRYERALAGETHSASDLTEVTGELKSHVTYFNPIKEDGKVTGISCFTEDVTQYTSLNRYLINLMENSNDYIFIKDADRKYVVASQSMAEVNGLTSWRDMIGKTDYDINPKNAPDFEKEEIRVLNERVFSINKERSFIDKDGQIRWVQSTNEPIIDENDKVIGLSGVSRDITKAREQGMFNQMLMSAIEATGDLIVFFDKELKLLYLNQEALKVYGDEDYLGKSLETVFDPKLFEYIKEKIDIKLSANNVWKDEYVINVPITGISITLNSAVVKVTDERGEFICYANVSRDVTEKNELKLELEELRISEERAIASNQAEEAERQRIAADLHDGVQQKIASATIMLQSMSDPVVIETIKVLKEAVDEIRITSHNLSLNILKEKGLSGAIFNDIERLSTSATTDFQYLQNIGEERFDSEIESNLYRIYQEATSNILKYANAYHVTVQIMKVGSMLTLQIEDDGIGFNQKEKQSSGVGLSNMQKRSNAINARFEIDSGNEGTCLIVEIILKPPKF